MKDLIKRVYTHKLFPRILYKKPDGGKLSGVTGYFLIEWKCLFSIGLLHFKAGSREAFHSHAFDAVTFWLTGQVTEEKLTGQTKDFSPSFKFKYTNRDNFHRVISHGNTWALTFRGPWKDFWQEYRINNPQPYVVLTHGRKELT